MNNIQIPNPCSEDWESMLPQEKGRFCSACSKCVIDFTRKTPPEIRQILEERKNEETCGRFYTIQLDPVQDSGRAGNAFFRYLSSAAGNSRLALGVFSFVLFLTSCLKKQESYRTAGLVVSKKEQDSLPKKDMIIGETVIREDTVKMPGKDSTRSATKIPAE